MARKLNVTVIENPELKPVSLNSMIDSYGELKDRINSLDKEAKSFNATIKERIKEEVVENDGKYISNGDNYVVTLTMRDTSKMNEEKLIAYLKKHKLAKGIVKRKEYVDEKAFEEAVYNGLISEEQLLEMDSCKDVSTTEVLTVKKKKGDK